MSYNGLDHYWIVATNPTQVWAGARGVYVATSDSAYVAWDAIDGNFATPIDTEANLINVINNTAASVVRAGYQEVSSGGAAPLCASTVPLPLYSSVTSTADKYLPQANLPISPVLGKSFYIKNNNATSPLIIKAFDTTTTITGVPDAGTVAITLVQNSIGDPNGTWAISHLPSVDPLSATSLTSGTLPIARIADDAVTNAKLNNMADSTIKGRAVGAGTGDPADLTKAQAQEVLQSGVLLGGRLIGANFNTTADQAITITSPTNYTIFAIIVVNASVSLTTAAGGVYPTTAKGGTAIVANTQVYTALTGAAINSTGSALPSMTVVTGAQQTLYNLSTIYFSLTTAQGSAATADIYVYIRRQPSP